MNTAGAASSGRSLLSNLSIQAKLVLAYGLVLVMFTATCLMVFVNYQELAEIGRAHV